MPSGPASIRAAAADDAALIAGAVGRHEGILRIFARQPLRHCDAFHQICRLQPRQKLLRRRAQRIAELHQPVEARNHAVFDSKRHDRLVRRSFSLRSESTKNVARPPTSSRSMAMPARAWSNVSTTTYSSSSRRILLDRAFVLLPTSA